MLNFLPQKNKNKIIFEYLLRIAVFLLLYVFVSSLILISLFFPSFFFAKYKNDTIKNQVELSKQDILNKDQDPVVFIKNVNKMVTALSSDNKSTISSYGEIINKIVSLKNKNIKILSIVITQTNASGGKKIQVSGIANDRDSLSLFNNNILADGSFSSVVFPVSSFIKSSDSEFSATLVL